MKVFLTQRRQGAKKTQNSKKLSAFACYLLPQVKTKDSVREALDSMLDETLQKVDEQAGDFHIRNLQGVSAKRQLG
jgi:hypothetical protein